MTDRDIMKQALGALEGLADYRYTERVKATMSALNDRLAQPEQSVAGYCKKIEELIAERDELRERLAQPERIQLTVRDFVVTVGGIEDAVGTPMYWAEWPNKEQP